MHTASASDGIRRNYFIGNDENFWAEDVQAFQEVRLNDVWEGIDIVCSFSATGFKYDFELAAGASPRQIALRYEGVDGLKLEGNNLRIFTKAGNFTERIPASYANHNPNEPVRVQYQLDDATQTVTFAVKQHDASQPLTIDPDLVFANLSGSPADNWGYTATYDESERAYGGGTFYSSPSASGAGSATFPTTPGAYQTSHQGGSGLFEGTDICLLRYNATGTNLQFATYIGGNSGDQPHSIVVDSLNRTYILARTSSNNFPSTAGAADLTYNGGGDIAVIRLDDGGGGITSTFVGGTGSDGILDNTFGAGAVPLSYYYADNFKGEIELDAQGNVFVASTSSSNNFPTTTGAHTPNNPSTGGSNIAGVVFSLDPELSSLRHSTFVGGGGITAAYNIEVEADGEIVVSGGTTGNTLPTTPNAWRPNAPGGLADGFVIRYDSSLASVLACSYIGGSMYDQAYFVDIDDDGDVYLAGHVTGSGAVFPEINSGYSEPLGGQFIIKLDSNFTAPEYVTRFGNGDGDPDLSLTAMLVDICENVYVSGWAGNTATLLSAGAPSPNPGPGFSHNSPQGGYDTFGSGSAFDNTFSGTGDFYFFVLEADASNLLYASYFGANQGSGEHVDGGTSRFDERGTIYQGICSACGATGNFPTTGGGTQTAGSQNCNLGIAKIDLDLIEFTQADFDASVSNNAGCAPFTALFTNNSSGATTSSWDFGDPDSGPLNTSTDPNPTHVYDSSGTYQVRLIISNPNSCILNDTTFQTIEVIEPSITTPPADQITCDTSLTFTANLSNPAPVIWDFGDGSTSTSPTVTHDYNSNGIYTLTLISNPGTPCPDTATAVMQIGDEVVSDFDIDYTDCQPDADFETTGDSYNITWDFGDGNGSNLLDPTHSYTTPGTYTITHVVATDFGNCADTSTQTLVFNPTPIASFEAPDTNCSLDMNLTNTSTLANTYAWDPGDGSGTVITTTDFSYTYATPGTYTVTLTASPAGPCTDDTSVTIVIPPIPTADFTADLPDCDSTLTVSANAVAATDTVYWRWGNGAFENDQPGPLTYVYPDTGEFALQMILANAFGCRDTLMDTIEVNPQSIADFELPDTVCGLDVALQNLSTLADSFAWTPGDGSLPFNSTDFNYTYPSFGTYDIQLLTAYKGACPDSITRTATVAPTPTAPFDIGQPACNNDIILTHTGTGADSLLWDLGDGNVKDGVQSNFTHTYADTGQYIVSLVAKNSFNCADTTQDTTYIYPIAQAAIAPLDTSLCAFDVTMLEASNFVPPGEHAWLPGDGSGPFAGDSLAHVYPTHGEYTITLVARPGHPCENQQTVTFYLPVVPTVSLDTINDPCDFELDVAGSGTDVEEWIWDFGDNTNSTLQDPPPHSYPAGDVYTVTLTANPDSICSADTSVDITIHPAIAPTATVQPNPLCGDSIVVSGNGVNGDVYDWAVRQQGDPTPLSSGSGQDATLFVPPAIDGNLDYELDLTVTSVFGCIETVTTPFERFPFFPAVFDTSRPGRCSRTLNVDNLSGTDDVLWQFGDGNVSTSSPTAQNIYADDDTFAVTLITLPGSGCPDTLTIDAPVGRLNVFAAFELEDQLCGTSIAPTSTGNGNQTWDWNFGDSLGFATISDPSYTYLDTGSYLVTLITDLGSDCEDQASQPITLLLADTVPILVDTARCDPEATFLPQAPAAVSYFWQFGDGETSTEMMPTHYYLEPGEFTVTLTSVDTNGCSDTTQIEVGIRPDVLQFLFIPNVFTPNGDGVNDEFTITADAEPCIDRVMIFDRWGRKVFETDQRTNFWDGKMNGRTVPEGVYVYVITPEQGRARTGTVTIIR